MLLWFLTTDWLPGWQAVSYGYPISIVNPASKIARSISIYELSANT